MEDVYSSQARAVSRKRIFREVLSMGCYLEDDQTGVNYLRPAVTVQITAVYQLRSAVTVQVDLLVLQGFPKFRFQKQFAD